jgi:hypothetical protein
MKSAVVKFVVSLVVFAAWLSWLGYIALAMHRPIVLSRPQMLVSTFEVIGHVEFLEATKVKIETVHWPASEKKRTSEEITVTNLAECDGWRGPGSYILLLTPEGKDWRVTPTPRSPGSGAAGKPRIYPATEQALHQLNTFLKPE